MDQATSYKVYFNNANLDLKQNGIENLTKTQRYKSVFLMREIIKSRV